MSLGLVGRKVGMMRIFRDDGTSVPVTVIDCAGNRVTQIKTATRTAMRPCRSPSASAAPTA